MSGSTFIRLCVGFLLGATGVHASCPIELNPPSVVVRYGESVSANCTTSQTEHEGLGWESKSGSNEPVYDVTSVVWDVANLQEWDASPICYITVVDGEQCLKTLPVVVYTFPDSISISSNADSAVMSEGEQYTITCDIPRIAPVQNLTVTWYKGNDTKLSTQSFADRTSLKNQSVAATFTFHASRGYDGARFRCEASLNLGPVGGPQLSIFSEEYPIKVHYGPDIACSNITISEDQNLEDQCSVTGNPSPTITWFKDGHPIDQAVALSRHNAGLYTIEAKGYINTNRTVHVFVMYGPEIHCPSTYIGVEYAPINISCRFIGYPSPSITYRDRDWEEVVSLPENPSRHDVGLYTIIASNGYSNVSHNLWIDVSYPPSAIGELEDDEVDVGSSVELKCVSNSNPRPEYSWIYFRAANVEVKNEDYVSILLIHNATANNMGSYTCIAWNTRGNVSRTARVTVKGVTAECPIKITPERMVVQYRGSGVATCNSIAPISSSKEISWRVPQGNIIGTQWSVNIHEDWDARPVCVATFDGIGQCEKALDFTMYKSPDSVSIHVVNQTGPLVEGTYQLRCDIINVAPVQKLTVKWLPIGTFATSYSEETRTAYDTSSTRAPFNVSSTINISLDRSHNGAEFRCEAHLDLGPEGPQTPLTMTSSLLNITVYYGPIINTTKLPTRIPVFRGYPVDLVCEADGHPPPKIQWLRGSVLRMTGGNLTVSEAGRYTCNATNDVASRTFTVEVILKEDYLPLIAGFVAVTVVVISVIFVFIYSIYYKNTRTRSYSLKKPKLSTPNGNVAHNGLDMQLPIPMTKLS